LLGTAARSPVVIVEMQNCWLVRKWARRSSGLTHSSPLVPSFPPCVFLH